MIIGGKGRAVPVVQHWRSGMRSPARTFTIAAAAVAALAATITPAVASDHGSASPGNGRSTTQDIAVIGDAPYGTAALGAFPRLIDQINTDPTVSDVVHIGDIKSGSSDCSDAYFARIKSLFDTFRDPLQYTTGDNEWTDCHNSGHVPTERLAKLRQVFFPSPGTTLGQDPMKVTAQPGLPEDVSWSQNRVTFGTFDVQGSNNDLVAWDPVTPPAGDGPGPEWAGRSPKVVDWLNRTFDAAEQQHSAGVALFLQADMWSDENLANGQGGSGYAPFVQQLAERAKEFGRPVVLINGDSHVYAERHPLDGTHYTTVKAPNLTQITIQRSLEPPTPDTVGQPVAAEWLDLHIDPRSSAVFSWTRKPSILASN
jgi:hypothetical protein